MHKQTQGMLPSEQLKGLLEIATMNNNKLINSTIAKMVFAEDFAGLSTKAAEIGYAKELRYAVFDYGLVFGGQDVGPEEVSR